MSARVASVCAALAVLAAVAFVVARSADEPYRVRLVLHDADGLRKGGDVRIGDVTAGQVADISLAGRSHVAVELSLEHGQGPVGRDASATIASLNLLGQKYVALDRGHTATPAPDGFTIPSAHVSRATDLDELLAVLDAGTRARLAVAINETGFAMTGRREDFSRLLEQLPHSEVAARRLLAELSHQTGALRRLVVRSDAWIGEFARERRNLTRLVDQAGGASAAFAAKHAQLRDTLAAAPGALRSLRGFLAELRRAAKPLGPAARNLTSTAPQLAQTLRALRPFRRAAQPALAEARAAADPLDRFAARATPVVRHAVPTLSGLATLGVALFPFTRALDGSANNLVAVMHNWARAVQFRDGVGHMFNGGASVTSEALAASLRRLDRGRRRATRGRPHRPAPSTGRAPPPARTPAPARPLTKPLEDLGHRVQGLVPDAPPAKAVAQLLDYLLAP